MKSKRKHDLVKVPRLYQIEACEIALRRNVILCLPTGSGKTFIAILVLKHYEEELSRSISAGGKRAFFLVPTKVLVNQQAEAITRDTTFTVGRFSSDSKDLSGNHIDNWEKSYWDEVFERYQVIVMTRRIFYDILNSGHIKPSSIATVIFDEIHRGAPNSKGKVTKDDYVNIMNTLDKKGLGNLRIVGLTASLLNNRVVCGEKMSLMIDLMEQTFKSEVFFPERVKECNVKDIIWLFKERAGWDLEFQGLPNHLKSLAEKISVRASKSNGVFDDDNEEMDWKAMTMVLESGSIPITFSQMKKTFSELSRIYVAFGPWSFHHSLKFIVGSYKRVLELIKNLQSSFVNIVNLVKNTLENFEQTVQRKLNSYSRSEAILVGVPNKMIRLLQILYDFNQKDDEDQMSCIVFVERRLDAYSLSYWLNAIAESMPEFGFIRSKFTVGSSNYAPFPFNCFHPSAQDAVVRDFKNKKLNILVSTSVLEEGLDINHCNLIIRYDEAKTFRAYVQSKGRARSEGAHFIFFAAESQRGIAKENIEMFHLMEAKLPCYQKPLNTNNISQLNNDDCLKTSTGAILPLSEAKNRVLFYCDHLPADSYTIKIPNTKVEEIKNDRQKIYYCQLRLPKFSPLHKLKIIGKKCLIESDAEAYSYFEACKELWAHEEMDDSFRPFPMKILIDRLLEKYNLKTDRTELKKWEQECLIIKKAWREENEKNGQNKKKALDLPPKPGTRKKRRLYPSMYSPRLKGYKSMDSPCWSYKVEMKDESSTIFHSLGLITFNPLPLIELENKLFIHSNSSKLKVSLQLIEKLTLRENQFEELKNFQEFIFAGCLKIGLENRETSKILSSPASSSYDLLFTFLTEDNSIDYSVLKQTYFRRPIVPSDYSSLEGALVSKNYGQNRSSLFVVEKVDYSKSPKTAFPDEKNATFEDYFRERYDISSLRSDQPLLACQLAPTETYFPSAPTKKLKRLTKRLRSDYLVPEICQFEYFSGSLVKTVYTIPALCSVLNQCLLATEIREQLCSDIRYGMSEIPSDVKNVWNDQRFTNFIPLKVDINFASSSHSIDFSSVLCTRLDSSSTPDNVMTTANCSIPMEEDGDDEGDYFMQEDDEEDDEEEKDSIDSDEEMKSLDFNEFIPPCNGDTHNTNQVKFKPSIEIYSSDQVMKFGKSSPPSINELPWIDDDLSFSCDLDSFERELNEHCLQLQITERDVTIDESNVDYIPLSFVEENSIISSTKSIYRDNSLIYKYGLPTELLIEALTTKKASAAINLERLEIIGDSFLKYIVSALLFLRLPELNEARITWLKMSLISNFYLFNLGRSKGLAQFINDKTFYPKVNWLPPFYSSSDQQFTDQEMNDKTIADMVEAMVGAHLICLGEDAAIKFLCWLGMPLESIKSADCFTPSNTWLPLYNVPMENQEEVNRIMWCSKLNGLEKKLGYEFKRKDLLIEALTHPSWSRSQFNSYQRLEFLGDAIIDYLITAYIYDHPEHRNLKPGQVTFIRQALVNNDYFGTIVLVNQFEKYMFHFSPTLFSAINDFRQRLAQADLLKGSKVRLGSFLLDSLDVDIMIDVPKALGDIFESIAGAIYLDSGNSLATVWEVYSRLIGNELEFFCANVPKSPICRFFEKFPDAKFDRESIGHNGEKRRLNLIVDGWRFAVKEDKLEGMSKRLERHSLVLCAFNKLVNNLT